MGQLGIDAFAIVAAALVLRARPAVVLAVLLGTAVLVPGPLPVPHTHFSYVTVQHVVALAALGRLLDLRFTRRIDNRAFLVGPVLPAFLFVIAVALVVGIVFSVHNGYSVGLLARLFDFSTMVVFLLACVVMVRRLDNPWRAMQIAGGVVVVSVAIAIVERITYGSWGHWLFSLLPDPTNTAAARPLDAREGQPRVRAGAEFALQFAWIAVMLLPPLVVAAARSRFGRFGAAAGAAVVLFGVYWSFSRSALAFAGVLLVLLAIAVRDSRVVSVLLLGVVAAGIVYEIHPVVVDHLSVSSDAGSVSLRFDRLSSILANLAAHPFRGLGLGNLAGSGFKTTDNALLLSYVELGVFGVASLLVLLLVVLAQCARAAVVALPGERMIAVACLLGAVAYVASTQAYDAFTLVQGPQVLCYLVAVATVVAERAGAPVTLPRPSRELLLGTAAAAVTAAGVVVALTPVTASRDYAFSTLPTIRNAPTLGVALAGKTLQSTTCAEAGVLVDRMRDVDLLCRPGVWDSGVGTLHLAARNPARLHAAQQRLSDRISGVGGVAAFRLLPTTPTATRRSGLGAGAAVLVPVTAVGLVLLVPWRRRRTETGARRRGDRS